jgi:hypothetical protein
MFWRSKYFYSTIEKDRDRERANLCASNTAVYFDEELRFQGMRGKFWQGNFKGRIDP